MKTLHFLFGLFVFFSNPSYASRLDYVPGEYVVKFKTTLRNFSQLTAGVSARLDSKVVVEPFQTDARFALVKVGSKKSATEVIRVLGKLPEIEYAEPNILYYDTEVPGNIPNIPNDSLFTKSWSLQNTGQDNGEGQMGTLGADIGALKAWGLTTGSRNVVVAVIDSGIDLEHEDLVANLYTNQKEIGGNGLDDDQNGFIDDIHGWNFITNNNSPMDDRGHGTHCAGIIGAAGGNSKGIAGVNWQVSLLPLKFISSEGSGPLSAAIEAIKYATKMHVQIISNSWGSYIYSQALEEAIEGAEKAGILVVSAAGNDGINTVLGGFFPAALTTKNVLSVSATDNLDSLPHWSNYGLRTVHLGAPGDAIMSTFPGNSYQLKGGTSMACPHVSGAAALLLSVEPNLTYLEVKNRLMETVDPIPSLQWKTIAGGRLNVWNALTHHIPPKLVQPWKRFERTIESEHPFEGGHHDRVALQIPGAHFIRVHFKKLDLEPGQAFVDVQNITGLVADRVTGSQRNAYSAPVEGDIIMVESVSEDSSGKWGFLIDYLEYL